MLKSNRNGLIVNAPAGTDLSSIASPTRTPRASEPPTGEQLPPTGEQLPPTDEQPPAPVADEQTPTTSPDDPGEFA